jgi:hypothetical protein
MITTPNGIGMDAVSGLAARYQYQGTDFYLRPGRYGPEWLSRNSVNYKIYSPSPTAVGDSIVDGVSTILVITPYANVTAQQRLLVCTSSSWDAASIYIGDGTNPRFGVESYSGLNDFAYAPANYELRRRYVLVAVSDANGSRLYIDGVLAASHSVPPGNLNLAKTLSLIGSNTAGAYGVEAFGMFRYALTDAEVADVSDNPWGLLASRQSYGFPSLSAGGGVNLAAAGSDTASGTGVLAVSITLAASGAAVAAGVAPVSINLPLSAVGVAQAGGTATDAISITLSAAGLATALGSAAETIAAQLAAAGSDTASGLATLSGGGAGSLAAAGGDTAGGTATAAVAATLAAVGAALASGSAALAIGITLAAAGSDTAAGTATINGSAAGQIAASGGDTAGGAAALRATVQISAAGLAQAAGQGALVITIPLAAFGSGQASGAAMLYSGSGVMLTPTSGFVSVMPPRRFSSRLDRVFSVARGSLKFRSQR